MERISVRRGEVYLLNFQDAGGRLTKRRPGLVVQNDKGNQRGTETIVAGGAAERHGHEARHAEVPEPVVDAGQLTTVSLADLGKRLGALPEPLMHIVDRALAISLGLGP